MPAIAASQVVADAGNWLDEAGWQTLEIAINDRDGLRQWVVFATRQMSLLRTDGATREEAWICAVEQARLLG